MVQSPEHYASAMGDPATEAAPVMAVKIGVDTGGTFSDFMLMDGDTLVIHKVLSTPDNPARAVLQGLRHLQPDLTGVDVASAASLAFRPRPLPAVGLVSRAISRDTRRP